MPLRAKCAPIQLKERHMCYLVVCIQTWVSLQFTYIFGSKYERIKRSEGISTIMLDGQTCSKKNSHAGIQTTSTCIANVSLYAHPANTEQQSIKLTPLHTNGDQHTPLNIARIHTPSNNLYTLTSALLASAYEVWNEGNTACHKCIKQNTSQDV
jgi:hypothetical protein